MMQNKNFREMTVGEIVALDFRAAEIFKQAGIDFCCGGALTLEKSCHNDSREIDRLFDQLNNLDKAPVTNYYLYKDWAPEFLIDFIKNTHHIYIRKALPDLLFYTQKIARVHGDNHPELKDVAILASLLNDELIPHLTAEENTLFPAIKEVMAIGSAEAKKTIHQEINRMNGEHEAAGSAMDKINLLTESYTLPADACNSYKMAFQLLHQFEDDLHVHVHLENNILFPKALSL